MFDTDLEFIGKHATYMKRLVTDVKLYKRYVDVYMNAAVFGLLHRRTAPKDRETQDNATIPASVFSNCRSDCVFLYRLVMLLDETSGLTVEQRVDRAFRDDADGEAPEKLAANMELFHSYVRGGIEEMNEQFFEGFGQSSDECLEHAIEVMEDFKNEVLGGDYQDRLDDLM